MAPHLSSHSVILLPRYPAYLACEIEPENPREQLYTVLWYKDDDGEPIYTYDARTTDLRTPKHWSEQEPRGFGTRARLEIYPHPAQLEIKEVVAEDAGLYRCRVDFKSSQTRNSLVTLSIISPPTEVKITWAGQEVSGPTVGPLTQGDTLSLTCTTSGSPAPRLAWYRDSLLVDATSEQVEREGSSLVSNTMNLHQVGERETRAVFTCRAENNNQTRPVSRTVRLRLNFPPADVRIVGLEGLEGGRGRASLLAGKANTVLCVSVGSRPAATITWWKDGQFQGRPQEVFRQEGAVTSSSLNIILASQDNNKSLVCRAENKVTLL